MVKSLLSWEVKLRIWGCSCLRRRFLRLLMGQSMHLSLSRILWRPCKLKWMSNLRRRLLCRRKFMRLIGIMKIWRLNCLISSYYWHRVEIRDFYVHRLKLRYWVWKRRLRRTMRVRRYSSRIWHSSQIKEMSRCRIILTNDNHKLL